MTSWIGLPPRVGLPGLVAIDVVAVMPVRPDRGVVSRGVRIAIRGGRQVNIRQPARGVVEVVCRLAHLIDLRLLMAGDRLSGDHVIRHRVGADAEPQEITGVLKPSDRRPPTCGPLGHMTRGIGDAVVVDRACRQIVGQMIGIARVHQEVLRRRGLRVPVRRRG